MPRNRLVFTAPIVLAVVLIGVFAIRSRGDNNANVDTSLSKDCPPVARADAVATKPGTAISIDVLANDTDPDGDPLVFQILRTTGGDSTIDDGGTPTDASDDRVQFTPADPPPPEATIEYQALDPAGAVGESTVTVEINDTGTLPAGVQSEPVPTGAKGSGHCAATHATTTSTSEQVTTETTGTDTTDTTLPDIITTGTTPRHTTSGHTTTTKGKTTNSTTATTTPHATTTSPPTTTPGPTTTQTTQPDPCGAYPVNGTTQEKADWQQCEKDRANNHGG